MITSTMQRFRSTLLVINLIYVTLPIRLRATRHIQESQPDVEAGHFITATFNQCHIHGYISIVLVRYESSTLYVVFFL